MRKQNAISRKQKEVGKSDQEFLTREFVRIGKQYGIPIRTCCENPDLEKCGADVTGCMTKRSPRTGDRLSAADSAEEKKAVRDGCSCLLGSDIGMYNTCQHGCVYCYANYDKKNCGGKYPVSRPGVPVSDRRLPGGRYHKRSKAGVVF